jgi:hypothetical protein
MFEFLIPAAASLFGADQASKAAKSAAREQAAAADRAAELRRESERESLALQQRMYEEGVARQQPYYEAGTNALAQMRGLTNAMPAAFQFRPEQLTTDPGYGFRLSEGLKALERSAAARGNLLSGGTGKALVGYGQEAASQEYGNAFNRGLTEYNALRQREADQYNRLAGMAGVGGTTAQQINAAGQNFAGQSGQNLLAGGQAAAQGILGAAGARASGYIGGANALTGALGAYLNYNQSQQMMNLLRPGAGMSMYSAPGFSNTPSYLVTPGGP